MCALVTGVQTCALPIWADRIAAAGERPLRHQAEAQGLMRQPQAPRHFPAGRKGPVHLSEGRQAALANLLAAVIALPAQAQRQEEGDRAHTDFDTHVALAE